MGLYQKSGFLDFDHIEKIADSNGINFIVIIGKRQVGKTYGTLDLMLRRGYYFALLRRTADEMKFITVDVNNPFAKLPYSVKIASESKYTASITRHDAEAGEDQRIGTVMALSTIAKIRGFDGSQYTDLVYDECIPETHVIKLRNEGDAFLNCYTTIAGNRELEGGRPLRTWLLANSNDLGAPILSALDIAQVVERMSYAGQEIAMLSKRGIMIILPKSDRITERRTQTALYRAVGTDSDFAKMSLQNEFSYNDASDVRRADLKQYRPLALVVNMFGIWEHKNNGSIHITDPIAAAGVSHYYNDDAGRRRFRNDFPDARVVYLAGGVSFGSVALKAAYIDFLYK